ncbi:MAG: type II secretion system protein [Candidatus Wallbacteria bacterium]|nr:type II secretion system protein [Candidatus Wallbacteria bacterium]
MLASLVIFSIIAVMAVPMAQTYRDRQTEVILKDRLSRIRAAIKSYAASELTTIVSKCNPGGILGDIDGDGVAGEDGAGDVDMDGFAHDDNDGNVDEDGPPIFPQTLEDLVTHGYLGSPSLVDDEGKTISAAQQFPRDPTNLDPTASNTETWLPLYVTRHFKYRCKLDGKTYEETWKGIYDVRSGSTGTSLAGVAYGDF